MELIALVLMLVAGYIMGYMSKGISITINKSTELEKDEQGNIKYNESLVDLIPPEQREYFREKLGRNDF